MNHKDLVTRASEGYELLDVGEGEKLERYGSFVLSRPDPQALWPKSREKDDWKKADASFAREGGEGKWNVKPSLPEEWEIHFDDLTFLIRPNTFKHTGLFPEQQTNWQWMGELLQKRAGEGKAKVLNLFGYTGGASLAAARAGAEVVHVDASKTAVSWARENAEKSGLADKPIRWIVEDALTFVRREIKRGNKYDGIVMDPPAFGRGPKGEVWKIEEDFLELMNECQKLLSDAPLFLLVNGYAAGYTPLAFAYNLEELPKRFGGEVEYGELHIEQSGGVRELPCGIYSRWSKE